jgi:NADH dehydrogenase
MPGRGDYPIYPLRTADLAAALVAAIDNPSTVGRIYELGSDEAVTLREIVRMVGERTGRRRAVVCFPLSWCRLLGKILEGVTRHPVLFAEQVRAMEARIVAPDIAAAKRDIGFSTPPFQEGLDALAMTWPPEWGGRRAT